MENKKQNWVLKGFSACTIVYASLSPLEHECEIEKLLKVDTEAEIPVKDGLDCDRKAFVVGLTNTVTPQSGDFIDCPIDGFMNG